MTGTGYGWVECLLEQVSLGIRPKSCCSCWKVKDTRLSTSSSFCMYILLKRILIFLCAKSRHSRKPWTKFINADNQHLAVPEVSCYPFATENLKCHVIKFLLKICWLNLFFIWRQLILLTNCCDMIIKKGQLLRKQWYILCSLDCSQLFKSSRGLLFVVMDFAIWKYF